MFQVKLDESNSTRRRIPVLLVDATDGYTPETGLSTFTVNVSQNGTILGSQTQSLTEVGNGIYYYTLGTGAVNTLGWVTVNVSATGCRQYNAIVQIMAYDAMDVVRLGLTAIPNAPQGTAGTLPTANASGQVTVVSNLDKTAYSLSSPQTFDLTGSITGNLTGSVNSVTTGVSLASGAITTGSFAVGAIDASALATSAVNEIANAVWSANINNDYAISPATASPWANNTFGDRVVISNSNNQNEVAITGSNHIAADIHEIQPNTIVDADFASGTTYSKLTAMIQSAGGGDFQFDAVALALAPSGGGGGGGSTTVRMGPFVIKAEGQGSDEPLDINKGATHAIECQLVDAEGTGVDITGATLTAKVYNSAGTLVETVSGTISYAALGQVRWTIGTTTTNTAGTYTVTITRTTGASDTQIFGPLRVYVRDI